MTERLSRVYLDDYPVTLMGDEAAPPLSRIVRAGGKKPDYVDVILLASPSDMEGRPLGPEQVIDRTAEPTRPIYLRTIPHDVKPIYTARPGPDEPRLQDKPARPPPGDVDPVIAQLGGKPTGDRPPHKKGVFRSPSQLPPERPEPAGAGPRTRKGRAKRPASASIRRAEAQAMAEAEAEQRQEEERNQEDTLQDEAEAAEEADDDGMR